MPTKHVITLIGGIIHSIDVAKEQDTHQAQENPRRRGERGGNHLADESSLPSPEWELKIFKTRKQNRTCWVSPTFKIAFLLCKQAVIFEGLRQKFHGDESKAWVEYRKRKGPSSVIACTCYDVMLNSTGEAAIHSTTTLSNRLHSNGWTRKPLKNTKVKRCLWLSPEFKIPFLYPKVAYEFECLRQSCNKDEEEALCLFTKEKLTNGKKVSDFIAGGQIAAETLVQNGGPVAHTNRSTRSRSREGLTIKSVSKRGNKVKRRVRHVHPTLHKESTISGRTRSKQGTKVTPESKGGNIDRLGAKYRRAPTANKVHAKGSKRGSGLQSSRPREKVTKMQEQEVITVPAKKRL